MDKFLKRLYELKTDNITFEELSIELGINKSTIYSWTSKSNMPKLNNIIAISNYFKCSIEYLLGRTDNLDELPAKDCPPFYIQLEKILTSKNLKKTHLRNKKVISRGLAESIFDKHASPCIENVVKIADYLNISVDELVGRV